VLLGHNLHETFAPLGEQRLQEVHDRRDGPSFIQDNGSSWISTTSMGINITKCDRRLMANPFSAPLAVASVGGGIDLLLSVGDVFRG
jgi:hypothetical protein